jgi:hypothetical protein
MTRFVCWSARIYSGFLFLYPVDLHRDFGAEMAEVFSEDLADAWRNRRLAGAAAVWWRAVSELFRIGLPQRLSNRDLLAPAISLAVHFVLIGGLLALASLARQGIPDGIAHGFITLRGQ